MMIVRDNCGHIKAQWDNHDECLKCSSCSRESTCSTCISWSNKIWKLADKRRTYSSRKWVMKKKHNKKQQVLSDSSDENLVDRITTPHGPSAWGRTHPGGNFKGTSSTQRSVSPLALVNRPLVIHPQDKKTSLVTGQPVTSQPVISQINTSHSITSHRSLDLDFQTPGRSQYSLVNQSLVSLPPVTDYQFVYQTSVGDTHTIGMEFTTNKSNLGSEHSYEHEFQNPTDNSRKLKKSTITPGAGLQQYIRSQCCY